jgi:hypothetical protein
MLFSVVAVVCLLSNPKHCENVKLGMPFEGMETPYVCFAQAQSTLADYLDKHPGWYVDRLKCTRADRLEG